MFIVYTIMIAIMFLLVLRHNL